MLLNLNLFTMGMQQTSTDTDIKKWEKPKLSVLDISNTQFGGGQTNDGDGFGEGDLPPLS
jgi:hypothetical protein